MQITILQNSDESFYQAIEEALGWANSLYVGVAYASYGAFNFLKSRFESFLRSNGKLRALFDIEEFITEKKLIEELATIPGDSECKVFIKPKNSHPFLRGHYHPKFYLFYNDEYYRVIIGSSNFTLGGIKYNIECNLSIYGQQDHLFFEFYNFFSELWSAEYAINVLNHGDLLDAYQQVFTKNVKETESKNKRLQRLRKKIQTKADHIIKSKKDILNEEFAYLLGLISGNSKIDFRKRKVVIDLQRGLANKGKEYEGYYYNPDISDYKISQYDAHKKDVDRITENVSLLIKHLGTNDRLSTNHAGGYHFQIILEFDKNSVILKELKTLDIPISKSKVAAFVPKSILESNDKKLIGSFIKGYCDLRSRISVGDGIYSNVNGKRVYSLLRMGISFPHNADELLDDFQILLKKIGLEEGVHVTDPSRRSRENLIRIDVRNVPYELLGTHWRRIFLKDFVQYMIRKSQKNNPNSA
ncbi:MAG: hypothetical protein HUU32_06025 [Calditrichaceae bacterium]|nr:phospholipase D-like domain-containing protein [Calditrichia bacterium]NUQ40935.1 hypothetical protein [Calditrichaceae bacterium]